MKLYYDKKYDDYITYEKICKRYKNLLYKIYNKYKYSTYLDKDDIMQLLLIHIYDKIDNFDSTKATLNTYLNKILWNKIKDVVRDNKVVYNLNLDKEYGEGLTLNDIIPDTSYNINTIIDSIYINRILDSLEDSRDNNIFIDYYINNISQVELSNKYNIKPPSISKIIKKVLNNIKNMECHNI